LSEYVPVAVNCTVFANPAIKVPAGVTAIDCSVMTVSVVDVVAVVAPKVKVAVIVSSPFAEAVASPLLARSLLTVAKVPGDEDHAASKVRSCVVKSENAPVADKLFLRTDKDSRNCWGDGRWLRGD